MKVLPFRLERQENDEWCWAAVATAIDHFFSPNSTRTQCQTVTEEFGTPCCGQFSRKRELVCDQPAAVPLARLGWLRGEPIAVDPIKFENVKKEIDRKRPVCVFIRWRNRRGLSDRGHYFVITGYRVTARLRFVFIQDPLFRDSWQNYDTLASTHRGGGYRNGAGVWRGTFLLRSARRKVHANRVRT